jgi:HPt (histidine-containing phosphotransfer) domain-containing protein
MRSANILDLQFTTDAFDGDEARIAAFLDFAIERSSQEFERLRVAIQEEKLSQAMQSTHRLKGALSNIGASEAAAIGRDAEEALRRGEWSKAQTLALALEFALDLVGDAVKQYKEGLLHVVHS